MECDIQHLKDICLRSIAIEETACTLLTSGKGGGLWIMASEETYHCWFPGKACSRQTFVVHWRLVGVRWLLVSAEFLEQPQGSGTSSQI